MKLAKPPPIWRPAVLEPSSVVWHRPINLVVRDAVDETYTEHELRRRTIRRARADTRSSQRQHRPPYWDLSEASRSATVGKRGYTTRAPTAPGVIPRATSPRLSLQAATATPVRPMSSSAAIEDPIQSALTAMRNLFSPSGNVEEHESAKLQRSIKSDLKEANQAPIDFASIRNQDTWGKPKLPCVFLHGLFGFSTLTPVQSLPLRIDYWRGVTEKLKENGVEVLITDVRTSASIEERARDAAAMIEEKFAGREVNIIGHSMGGLDSRFLTSCLKDHTFKVKSVTTIATPHRGSPFASYLLYDVIGKQRLPTLLSIVQTLAIPGGGEAFECLTTERMKEFNEYCKDCPDVKYYSWGAAFKPGMLSEFRFPWGIIWEKEGHNDGLVSVESAQWGEYKGTLKTDHIAIIGWGNALQLRWANLTGAEPPLDSQTFYLNICDDLAKEGF